MKYIDLTHIVNSQTPVFPGDPGHDLHQIARIDKDGFVDHQITTGMHTGTHMDAPAHMLEGGKYLHEYPPEKFFCRGVIVDARGKPLGTEELLSEVEIKKGDAVLVCFGWSTAFGNDEYYQNYPVITEGMAEKLSAKGICMIGTDTPSPDRAPYAAHKIFFRSDILIIENLTNLESLIGKNFELIALPAKFEADAAPVRVVAGLSRS